MRLSACSAALVVLFSSSAFAQTPAEMPAPPMNAPPVLADTPPAAVVTLPPAVAPVTSAAAVTTPAATPLWYNVLRLEALVDSYYQYNFSGDPSIQGPATVRQFDLTSNSFSLNYAKVGLQLDASPVTVRIDLGYGHTGLIINGGSALGSAMGQAAGLYGNAFIVQQAYASLALGALTIDFGKFVTTAGAEVIEANKNWLYSRSLLFFAIPLLHTGVRANLKVSDMLSLQASVVNGINNDPDNNGWKTVGLSATLNPLPTTSIIVTDYFGKEGAQGAQGDMKNTLDLVVSHTVNDKLALNLNADYIKLGDAYTIGGSLMGRFIANERLILAARGEFVKDKGLTFGMPDTSYYEGTVMVGFPVAGHLEVRTELRGDFSGEDVFNGDSSQFTGTVAFLGFL